MFESFFVALVAEFVKGIVACEYDWDSLLAARFFIATSVGVPSASFLKV